MNGERAAGVLLHISSLSGRYGIGSLGKEAYKFAKTLAKCGVKYWQILPLVQTGYGDSPYQSACCISGNPYFIDLDMLAAEGLLKKDELKAARMETLDYGRLYAERYPLLRTAFSRFPFDSDAFRAFVKTGKFEDYALFMTAKTVYGGSFSEWEEGLKRHTPEAVENLRTEYHEEYLFWQFLQYEFWRQWELLHAYCKKLGVSIIGDIPLYVAYDSADVWAHPELFKLDQDLRLTKVAGVPPDYFSENGQLWGNPIYDWKAHEAQNYSWWHGRLQNAMETYDLVRIDHFRGLDRYYEIDADAENAKIGEWQDGPKDKLFEGDYAGRFIAEDLGIIDSGVVALREKTGFPGMKVLLFAFTGDDTNENLPANFREDCVVYTGTHDNDTVKGYADRLTAEEYVVLHSRVAQQLQAAGVKFDFGTKDRELVEAFCRLALASKARLAVLPVQDILKLGNEARMNYPGAQRGNWTFRLKRQLPARVAARLKKLIKLYRRKQNG